MSKLIKKFRQPAGPIEYIGMPKEEFDWMVYMFENDPNNPKYKWFLQYAKDKYERQGDTRLPEVVIEAKRPEKTLKENAKETAQEMKETIENLPTETKVDLALTGAGFIPYLDTAADVFDLGRSLYNGDYSNAAFALAGLALPVSGQVLKQGIKSIKDYRKARLISNMLDSGIKPGAIEVPVEYFSSPSALYRRTIGDTEIDDVKQLGYFRTSAQSSTVPKEMQNRSHGVSGWTKGYPFWHPKKKYPEVIFQADASKPHHYFEVDGAGKMFSIGDGGQYGEVLTPFEDIPTRNSEHAWKGQSTGAVAIKPGEKTILGEETRLFTYNPNTGNYTYQGYIQPDKRIVGEFKNIEVGKGNRPATLERMNIHARIKPKGKSLFIDNFFNNPRNNQFISEYDPNYKWSPITYGDISQRGDFMFDQNDIGNTVTTINEFSDQPYSMIKATYEHPKYKINKFVELKQGGNLIPKHAKGSPVNNNPLPERPINTNPIPKKEDKKKNKLFEIDQRVIGLRPTPGLLTFPKGNSNGLYMIKRNE